MYKTIFLTIRFCKKTINAAFKMQRRSLQTLRCSGDVTYASVHDFTHDGLSMTWPQLDLDPQDIGRLFLLLLQHSRIVVRRLALNGIDEIGFLQISSLELPELFCQRDSLEPCASACKGQDYRTCSAV